VLSSIHRFLERLPAPDSDEYHSGTLRQTLGEHRLPRLRTPVLLALATADASSVTELATRVLARRSGTSRVLRVLESDGLVRRHGLRWGLTERGIAEAERLREELALDTQRNAKLLERVVARQERWNRIVAPPTLPPAAAELFDAVSATRRLIETSFQPAIFTTNYSRLFDQSIRNALQVTSTVELTASFANLHERFLPDFSEALRAVLDSVSQSKMLVAWAEASLPLATLGRDIAARHSLLLSQMAIDVSRIGSIMSATAWAWEPSFTAGLAELTQAHAAFSRDLVRSLANPSIGEPLMAAVTLLPVMATRQTVRASRALVGDIQSGAPLEQWHFEVERDIEVELGAFDRGYVELHQGARARLREGGPDAVRQSMASARELLDQMLTQMVPLEDFTPAERLEADGRRGSYRAIRARKVVTALGKRHGQLAEAIERQVTIVHAVLSGEVHRRAGTTGLDAEVAETTLDALDTLIRLCLLAERSRYGDLPAISG